MLFRSAPGFGELDTCSGEYEQSRHLALDDLLETVGNEQVAGCVHLNLVASPVESNQLPDRLNRRAFGADLK